MISEITMIVFSKRVHLRNAVTQACQELDWINERAVVSSKEELLKKLKTCEKAITVLDWELGPGPCSEILSEIKLQPSSLMWATGLLSRESSGELLMTAGEFKVNFVRSESVTANDVLEDLNSLKTSFFDRGPLTDLLDKASQARLQGNYVEASQVLAEIYSTNPNDTLIRNEYASNLIQEERWKDAFELLKDAATENSDAYSLNLLARVLLKFGKKNEASTALKRARLINPTNTKRLVELGNILFDDQDLIGSKQAYDEAKKIDPKNKGAIQGSASCMLVDGDVQEALNLMKGSVNSKDIGSVFNTSAIMQIQLDKFDDAIELYNLGIKALTGSRIAKSRVIYNKGVAYFKAGEHENALKAFKEASGLDSNFSDAKHNYDVLECFLASQQSGEQKVASGGEGDSLGQSFDDLSMNLEDLDISDLDDDLI